MAVQRNLKKRRNFGLEKVKCILNNKSVLGEGPVWDESRKKLFFVDIMGKKINSFDPITKEFDSIETENPVGCIVFHKDNNIISAQQNKLVKINLDTKESVKILDFNLDEYLRFNDGKCDINGRLPIKRIQRQGSAVHFFVQTKKEILKKCLTKWQFQTESLLVVTTNICIILIRLLNVFQDMILMQKQVSCQIKQLL